HGEWTYREDPIMSSELEPIVKESVKKYGITWEEALEIVKARAEKIENTQLRNSFEVVVYELLTRLPGEGMRPCKVKDTDKKSRDDELEQSSRVNFGKKIGVKNL